MANPAFDTLPVRTLSGIVLFVGVAAAILISPYTFALLLLLICIGGVREFYLMAREAGAKPQVYAGMACAALIVTANFLLAAGFGGFPMGIVLALAFILFFALFAAELYRKQDNPLVNIATTITGVVYVAFPLSLMCYLGVFPLSGQVWAEGFSIIPVSSTLAIPAYRPWIILGYIFIVWINDIGAYLFGVSLGRHRLFERISPKKSWEGFIGGLIVAVALAAMLGWLFTPQGGDVISNIAFWTGLAAVVVVTGVLGDLIESLFKRSVGVKDSGNSIPGHGGVLDRFDALIYSAPFVFLYFIIFAG